MQNSTQTPNVRLVAIDIDGTLLNSKHKLSERNEKALKAAIEQGVEVVLATGKTREAAAYVLDKLKVKTYGIYTQGTVVYNKDGNILEQWTLKPNLVRQIITFAEERGFAVFAYNDSTIYARAHVEGSESYISDYHENPPKVVGALQNLTYNTPIHKLIAVGDPRQIKALRWQLNAQLGSSVRLMQAGLDNMLEVLPPNVSKGTALRVLLKELNIPASAVMAMGDAENDIEMLQVAGLGLAMGNAEDKLKSVAKHVIATNDEDGVAQAIERFALKQPEKPAEPETTKTEKAETTTEATASAAKSDDKPAEAATSSDAKEEK